MAIQLPQTAFFVGPGGRQRSVSTRRVPRFIVRAAPGELSVHSVRCSAHRLLLRRRRNPVLPAAGQNTRKRNQSKGKAIEMESYMQRVLKAPTPFIEMSWPGTEIGLRAREVRNRKTDREELVTQVAVADIGSCA